ncbi:hypothetical protein ACP0HM_34940 [Escherichia coli]
MVVLLWRWDLSHHRFNEFITTGPHGVVLAMFPLIWIGVVCVIGAFSAPVSSLLVVGAFEAPLSVVYVLLAYAIWIIYGLIAFLLDANLSATNPPAIPHWWKRQPLIPNLLSQELKNYLKLNVKEKKIFRLQTGNY